MRITKLEGVSSLTIVDNITLYGSTIHALTADQEFIKSIISSVSYPLPDVEIVILPFVIGRIDDYAMQVDGVAAYAERKIYLSAFHRFDWNTEAYRLQAWVKTLLHEIGHMVHYEYLPQPHYGPPEGLWKTFCEVGNVPTINNSYETSIAEAFAEWWRLLFSTASQAIPHRHGLRYRTGLKEWILSLTGALTLAVDHKCAYWMGGVTLLDVGPSIQNGRALVPLRFVTERFGNKIEWMDPETIAIWPKAGG